MAEPRRSLRRNTLRRQNDSNPEWLAYRFEFFVDRSGGPDACHVWLGRLNDAGYGEMRVLRRAVRAHRLAYELAHGSPIPAGLFVLHSCDNPPCVNVAHLTLGTNKDNQDDMRRKGRGSTPPRHVGETHPGARLTAADVAAIRSRYSGQHGEKAALAREFGVSNTMVGYILAGTARQWG